MQLKSLVAHYHKNSDTQPEVYPNELLPAATHTHLTLWRVTSAEDAGNSLILEKFEHGQESTSREST